MAQSDFLINKISDTSRELKHLISDFESNRNILYTAFYISKSLGKIEGLLLALNNIDSKKYKTMSHLTEDTIDSAVKTINKLF